MFTTLKHIRNVSFSQFFDSQTFDWSEMRDRQVLANGGGAAAKGQ